MIEYEELRAEIDRYLMERFKYRKPLVRLTVDNIITTRRNSRIDLYLRIRRVESQFPPDSLIIARLSFTKERIWTWNALCQISDRSSPKVWFQSYWH